MDPELQKAKEGNQEASHFIVGDQIRSPTDGLCVNWPGSRDRLLGDLPRGRTNRALVPPDRGSKNEKKAKR